MKRLLFTLFIALCGLSASAEEIRYMCIEQTNGTVTKLPVSTIARISFVLENVDPNPASFAVTLLVNDATMGSVSGAGAYPEGATATFTATANSGYRFVRWSDGETTNPRTMLVSEDITLTAVFEQQSQDGFNGHAYVDLGLPSGTLWATCNIGAEKPVDNGYYFAWGETEPKEVYTENTYKWFKMDTIPAYEYEDEFGVIVQVPEEIKMYILKYNTAASYGIDGFVDNKTTLDLEDDAAHVNWGGDWRMPTYEEIYELNSKCTWEWQTGTNAAGEQVAYYKVTGPNGNSIALPAAGYRYGTSLYNVGSYGYVWSSSLYENDPGTAYILYFYSDDRYWYYYYRYSGRSVRPVCSSAQK